MLLCNLYTLKKLYILYTINLCMLWSKNQKIIYYYQIACQSFFFLQRHNINIKNQSTPGVHAVFPVGGAWTCFEGCLTQSLFSENVYENESWVLQGVCTRKFCYICQCMTPTQQQQEISLKQHTDIS